MDKIEINKIVDAWIKGTEAKKGTSERESNWWAVEQVIDWTLEHESENLWQFILSAYKRDTSKEVLAVLAAGALEDLLVSDGQNYIDRIEKIARQDKKFNWLLGGVWRSRIKDEVWKRVELVRDEVW